MFILHEAVKLIAIAIYSAELTTRPVQTLQTPV